MTQKPLVLVTGSSGSLGQEVISLLPSKYKLLTLSADLRNLSAINLELSSIPQIHFIIHLAGVTDTNAKKLKGHIHDNLTMAENINYLAIDKKVTKIIFTSSHAVNYSHRPYAVAKKECEDILLKNKIPCTVMRPTMIYGPNSPETLQVIKLLKTLPLFPYITPPTQIQPVLVTDVAKAIIGSLDKKLPQNIYNLAGPNSISTFQFLKILQATSHSKNIFVPIPKLFVSLLTNLISYFSPSRALILRELLLQDITSDSSEAQKDLHWTPQTIRPLSSHT